MKETKSTPSSRLPSGASPPELARPKVLFIIDQLCEMGGAERVLLNMARALPSRGFDCSMVTFKVDSTLPVFDNFPCPLQVMPLSRTYGIKALRVASRLYGLIRKEKIDIVHTFFETSDLWASTICRFSAHPVLISSRRDMGILRSAKHQLAYKFANRMFDEVQTVSNQVRDHFIAADGLSPDRVVTVYNGVSLDRARPQLSKQEYRAQLGLQNASHVVTTIAHLRRVKGVDIFLRAASKVCEQMPRTMFLVVGDAHEPGQHAELLALRAQLGLANNVRFLGPVEDVFPVLHASDAFCLLSRSEGFSNAILEAMACQLPCVATAVGGNPELVLDGRNGLLVASEDVHGAAGAVLGLLSDSAKAARMGREGRELVEGKFSEESMMAQLATRYRELLSKRNSGRPLSCQPPLTESEVI